MLGKTAGGLFWLFRYMERSENMARMIDAGLRISLTRGSAADAEWTSILRAVAMEDGYRARHGEIAGDRVVDFLLRDPANPGSVMANVEAARNNARLVRTALTREVWEAVNECYMVLRDLLAEPIADRDLPRVLQVIRQRSAFVRGARHGSMVRNDIYDFARIGGFFERADSTARMLQVKYYILLPSVGQVGGPLDNVQWETILRATASVRAFQTLYDTDVDPHGIVQFLVRDRRLPRSLAFCLDSIHGNLDYLKEEYGTLMPCHDKADAICRTLRETDVDGIFDYGLQDFVGDFIRDLNDLGRQIEIDYRFYE